MAPSKYSRDSDSYSSSDGGSSASSDFSQDEERRVGFGSHSKSAKSISKRSKSNKNKRQVTEMFSLPSGGGKKDQKYSKVNTHDDATDSDDSDDSKRGKGDSDQEGEQSDTQKKWPMWKIGLIILGVCLLVIIGGVIIYLMTKKDNSSSSESPSGASEVMPSGTETSGLESISLTTSSTSNSALATPSLSSNSSSSLGNSTSTDRNTTDIDNIIGGVRNGTHGGGSLNSTDFLTDLPTTTDIKTGFMEGTLGDATGFERTKGPSTRFSGPTGDEETGNPGASPTPTRGGGGRPGSNNDDDYNDKDDNHENDDHNNLGTLTITRTEGSGSGGFHTETAKDYTFATTQQYAYPTKAVDFGGVSKNGGYGYASWYTPPEKKAGPCGTSVGDFDYAIKAPKSMFQDGRGCGRWMRLRSPETQLDVYATIQDLCGGCDSAHIGVTKQVLSHMMDDDYAADNYPNGVDTIWWMMEDGPGSGFRPQ